MGAAYSQQTERVPPPAGVTPDDPAYWRWFYEREGTLLTPSERERFVRTVRRLRYDIARADDDIALRQRHVFSRNWYNPTVRDAHTEAAIADEEQDLDAAVLQRDLKEQELADIVDMLRNGRWRLP